MSISSAKMVKVFIDAKMMPRIVCTKKHADQSKCKRPHEVPSDALYQGETDLIGQFRIEVRETRKAFKKSDRRFRRLEAALIRASERAAPAFRKWISRKLERHQQSKPVFAFTPRP